MKIYLLDIDSDMTDAWKIYFKFNNIEIVNEDFVTFMDNNQNIEAIVSPDNSFGFMNSWYNIAIIDYFGKELMENIKKIIIQDWCGEQPVGTSITIPIYNKRIINDIGVESHPILIHTPSMRTPEQIKDSRIIYQCMRTTLIEAERQEVSSIVIPALCGSTGKVPCDEVAKMMFLAYMQIRTKPTEIDEINWDYALNIAKKLRR